MTSPSEFFAQYYELTLRVRFQNAKWIVIVLGPHGLLITGNTKYQSRSEAEQAAVILARTNFHEEKHDPRPMLEEITWQSS